MSLPVPRLDDRGWTELVEAARARIPRVTGEWTDFNVHDPGITFIELFAWLAEMQRFRLDQLSAETVRRFLRLTGLEPEPLRPARTWVRFAPLPGATGPSLPAGGVLVRAGTPVVRAGPDTLPFQAARDTFLTPNEIRGIRTVTGERRVEQLEANATPGVPFFAFGEQASVGAALEVEMADAFAEPLFDLGVELAEDDLPPVGGHAGEAESIHPSAELAWEYAVGGAWKPMTVREDGTQRFHRSGVIHFLPPADVPRGTALTLRCRMAGGRFEVPPRVRALSLNVVEVVQVETEMDEPLGEGDGRPDQAFRLGAARSYPLPPLEREHLVDRPESRTRVQAGDLLAGDGDLQRALSASAPDAAARLLRALPAGLTEAGGEGGDLRLRALPASDRPGERDRALFALAGALDALLDDPAWLAESDDAPPPEESPFSSSISGPGDSRAQARAVLARRFPGLVGPAGLRVEVGRAGEDGRVEWESWDPVESLDDSAWRDPHYALEAASPTVRFGNGLNGRVPRRGDRVRARVYHHSRGARGNVPPRQQWNLGIPGVRLAGTNPLAGTGGRDPETVEEMRLRAEERYHERARAVTGPDLERLATATPGLRVHRARAVANHDPRFCGVEMPGSVTVVVVPWQRPGDTRPPVPGEGFRATVAEHLERHRLLTTTIHVVGPRVVRFALSARVFLAPRSAPAEVLRRLRQALSDFFDPLRGGPEARGWPLGRAVYPSEIYERLDRDPGVDYATRVRLTRLDEDERGRVRRTVLDADQPMVLPPTGLPLLSWSDSALETTAAGADAFATGSRR